MQQQHPFHFDRRTLLAALGSAPIACVVGACSNDAEPEAIRPDLAGTDEAIRPQDDLYRHVNGRWLREYRLPPDKSSFGTDAELSDRTRAELKTIIESIDAPSPGSDEQKIRDLYDAFLDTAAIERLGISPVADLLAAVETAATKTELSRVMSALTAVTSPMGAGKTAWLFGVHIGPDQKDTTRCLPTLSQAGLGLPDESYYRDSRYADQLAAYRRYLERLAAAARLPDPPGVAACVVELETRIAACHWDNIRTRDPIATYNVSNWAQLRALAPGFEWDAWLAPLSDNQESFGTVVVAQPSYVAAAARLWADTDIAVLRDYLRIGVLRRYAPYLSKDLAEADFDFESGALQGVHRQPERWQTAVELVDTLLAEPLGRKYVAERFSAESKRLVKDLVTNIVAAYRASFEGSEWMSKPTRDAAIVKLGKIEALIGYPDRPRDYSGLAVTEGRLVKSIRAATAFENHRCIAKLGTPVDRGEWDMSPQTVNAYYSAEANQIVFPAAILQAPYFDKDATAAVNYGGIGAVIGHEIGHGFDDQGSKYDADGNLRDWWTTEDRAAFDKKTTALIEQYDLLVPDGMRPAGARRSDRR